MTRTIVASATREIIIGFDQPFCVIGERINPTGRKKLAAEMIEGNFDTVIKDALEGSNAFVWDGAGDNPYLGMLALADVIIATPDSTNMAVEAAATGKPLYIVDIPGGSAKFDRLHESLRKRGVARTFVQLQYLPLGDDRKVSLPRRHSNLAARVVGATL